MGRPPTMRQAGNYIFGCKRISIDKYKKGATMIACNENRNLFPPAKPSNRLTSPLPASLHTRAETLQIGATMFRHGEYRNGKPSPEMSIWHGMRQRCYLKTSPAYKRYGGRGIKMCARWRDSFKNFLKDVGRRPSKKLTKIGRASCRERV